jgi:hypothetical protein
MLNLKFSAIFEHRFHLTSGFVDEEITVRKGVVLKNMRPYLAQGWVQGLWMSTISILFVDFFICPPLSPSGSPA